MKTSPPAVAIGPPPFGVPVGGIPSVGSNAEPFQFPPPVHPGKITRSFGPYCAYGPPVMTPPSSSSNPRQYFSCSGVKRATSSGEKVILASGGGFRGNGCVGEYSS